MSWGNPETIFEHWRTAMLSPISAIYGLGNSLHRFLYTSGVVRRKKLAVPVISVGNISCGGTGKTPVIIAIARYLLDQGLRVGVLSRGYKRRSQTKTVLVCDGNGYFANVNDAGDEPLLIANSLRNAVVLAGCDRYLNGLIAQNDFHCDILLLDDGFQHYQLERDLDIVLIDYNDEPENDSLLPGGRLREPLTSLARSSHVLITKVPDQLDQIKIKRLAFLVKRYCAEVTVSNCRMVPKGLQTYKSGLPNVLPLQDLTNVKVVTFCGLARPQNFTDQIRHMGANIQESRNFPDHHWYSSKDIDMLMQLREASDSQFLVTTEKDFVKLQSASIKDKLLVVELSVEWASGIPKKIRDLAAATIATKIKSGSTGQTKPENQLQAHVLDNLE
jgi:tetraacyldisaccharide 4'-kinase